VDEDRLTPRLGRLIDAAKAAAGEAARAPGGAAPEAARAEGWAVLGVDGKVYRAPRLAAAVAAARTAGTEPEAAAFAVTGESGDTLLPRAGWRAGAEQADPHLPVAVKYLGRWVLVTLEEIPAR
jgi:hypothetical protein